MGVFLAILMMMTTGSVAVFVIVRAIRSDSPANIRTRTAIVLLVAATVVVFCDLMTGDKSLIFLLPFDMLVSLFPMLVIASSVAEEQVLVRCSKILSAFAWLLALYYILRGAGLLPSISPEHFMSLSGLVSIIICTAFLFGISMRMREIRQVMQDDHVWTYVSLSIDVIYLLVVMIYAIALLLAARISSSYSYAVSFIVSLLMACQIAALGLRLSLDSLFLIWRKHERSIVESMKVSQTEVAQDPSKTSGLYKDIYARVVNIFETEKLYLNSELTINDVVKVTYTNKLYISRAINKFTGKNFCQFVNYYRVLHSIKIFSENPDLKVSEMALRSGFNSTVSFSMAFRLYMNDSPSDWCRKEKYKLDRRKK